MIMLYLYLQAIKNKTAHGAIIAYSASTLAKEFFVSRIHVNRIIKSAQEAGYLKDRGDGRMSDLSGLYRACRKLCRIIFCVCHTLHQCGTKRTTPCCQHDAYTLNLTGVRFAERLS